MGKYDDGFEYDGETVKIPYKWNHHGTNTVKLFTADGFAEPFECATEFKVALNKETVLFRITRSDGVSRVLVVSNEYGNDAYIMVETSPGVQEFLRGLTR